MSRPAPKTTSSDGKRLSFLSLKDRAGLYNFWKSPKSYPVPQTKAAEMCPYVPTTAGILAGAFTWIKGFSIHLNRDQFK